jgi:hypothetical protein
MDLKLPDVNAAVADGLAEHSQPAPVAPAPEPASASAEAASDLLTPPAVKLSEPAPDRVGAIEAERFSELSQVVTAYTVPWSPRRWDFLPNEMGARIEASPLEFVKLLENEFGKSILTELGLHEQVGDELRLPACFVEDADLYVTIDKENRTFKFRAIHQPEVPRRALDYALVQATQECAPYIVFVTDSESSADILRLLGLHSVTCDGLESLVKSDLDKIFDAGRDLELRWRYYLILLDFDVVCLQNKPTDAIGEVIRWLADAEQAFRIDLARRFAVCRPDAIDFERLDKAIAFKDAVQVTRVFQQWSIIARAAKVASWYSYVETGPITFSAAHEELQRAIELPMPLARQTIEIALSSYRDTYRRFIRQLRNEAQREADVYEKIEKLAGVAAAEAFFDVDLLVQAAEFVLENQIRPPMHELRQQALEQQMRYLSSFRANRTTRKRKR